MQGPPSDAQTLMQQALLSTAAAIPKCLQHPKLPGLLRYPCGPPGLQVRLPRHGLGLSCQNHCLQGQQALLGELKIPLCALLCLETRGNQIFNVLSRELPAKRKSN